MTQEIARIGTDSWVQIIEPVGDLATKIAGTQFVPKAMQRNPAAVAAAILLGREMGLGPMASLRGIDVIEGRPSLTAHMLAARVLAAGHAIEWLESTDTKCTVRITRSDGLSTAEVTWTRQDAERAGLWGKGAWRGFPRHMLRHRALSEAASMAAPDVAMGLDVSDAAPGAATRPATSGTVIQVPAVEHVEAEIVEAEIVEVEHVEVVEVAEPGVTRAQMRHLQALITDLEHGTRMTRDERRTLIADLAGVPDLKSASDLTSAQASAAIDALQTLTTTPPDDEATSDAHEPE